MGRNAHEILSEKSRMPTNVQYVLGFVKVYKEITRKKCTKLSPNSLK